MSDENDKYEGTGLVRNLNKNIRPFGLLLKSISQDSFEVQHCGTLWSNTDFAYRLELSNNSKECVSTTHRVLLQVIFQNVLFFFIYRMLFISS